MGSEVGTYRIQIYRAGLFLLLAAAITGGFACGKRKPPLPPEPKVFQRAEITGIQRGNRIVLSWKMPDKNAAANDVRHIRTIDVYRLAEPLTTPTTLNEEQFANRSVLIGTLPVRDDDFGLKTLSYTDTLQLSGQTSRLRYAVRFVNASGQKAPFSNIFTVEPENKVAAAPTSLLAEVTQEAIELNWTAPTQNADGTTPVNLAGYNVYRSRSKTEAGTIINKAPVTDSKYSDSTFEFEKEHYYFVRAISTGTGDTPTESGESNVVEVLPKDTFRPSAPASITIGASPNTVSLFFPPNPEPDIAGYRIYRTEDQSQDRSLWKLLTTEPITANTFQDATVEAGKTYYYYVTAVDKFGNVSEMSEVVSETVPKTEDLDDEQSEDVEKISDPCEENCAKGATPTVN